MKAIKVLEVLNLGATIFLFGFTCFLQKSPEGNFALVTRVPTSQGGKITEEIILPLDVSFQDFIIECEEISEEEYNLLYINYGI